MEGRFSSGKAKKKGWVSEENTKSGKELRQALCVFVSKTALYCGLGPKRHPGLWMEGPTPPPPPQPTPPTTPPQWLGDDSLRYGVGGGGGGGGGGWWMEVELSQAWCPLTAPRLVCARHSRPTDGERVNVRNAAHLVCPLLRAVNGSTLVPQSPGTREHMPPSAPHQSPQAP